MRRDVKRGPGGSSAVGAHRPGGSCGVLGPTRDTSYPSAGVFSLPGDVDMNQAPTRKSQHKAYRARDPGGGLAGGLFAGSEAQPSFAGSEAH